MMDRLRSKEMRRFVDERPVRGHPAAFGYIMIAASLLGCR